MALVPLESNPEVMTKFLHKLGVPKKWQIVDVYGLEPDLLAVVPQPVLAVILLYPYAGKNTEELQQEEEPKVQEGSLPSKIYFLKQYISNACGTIALIHSVANNTENIKLEDGVLKSFLDSSKDRSYTERGELLVESQGLTDTHKELALEGQTEVPGEDVPVIHHFIAFVHVDGTLYELDGRKSAPIAHGPTKPESLLEDAARVCKEYMSRDPEEMRFTVVALTASD